MVHAGFLIPQSKNSGCKTVGFGFTVIAKAFCKLQVWILSYSEADIDDECFFSPLTLVSEASFCEFGIVSLKIANILLKK